MDRLNDEGKKLVKQYIHLLNISGEYDLQSPVKQRASPERTARLSGTNGV